MGALAVVTAALQPNTEPGHEAERTPVGAAKTTARGDAVATRLVIESLGVDPPIVPGDTTLPGNPPGYPLCNVAHFLARFSQPAEHGATYLYGHAQAGMLLPLLEASKVDDGAGLIGQRVLVYTSAGHEHEYRIFEVKRHASNFRIARRLEPGEERLVIQRARETTPPTRSSRSPPSRSDDATCRSRSRCRGLSRQSVPRPATE